MLVRRWFGLALVALTFTLVSCRSDKAGEDANPVAERIKVAS
jgi:hypothetical protein